MATYKGATLTSSSEKKVPFLIGVTGGTSCGKVRCFSYGSTNGMLAISVLLQASSELASNYYAAIIVGKPAR